jgi:hypothetical protein
MGGVTLTGSDTIILGSRVFSDFADGDVVNIDFPNNLVETKTGKNGNTIYALNSTGKVATVTMRVLRGSADDKYMNSQMNLYLQDPPSYTLLDGEFIKRVGDGQGNVTNDIYQLNGGAIQKLPGGKDNVEGDTEAAVTVWQVVFSNTARAIA